MFEKPEVTYGLGRTETGWTVVLFELWKDDRCYTRTLAKFEDEVDARAFLAMKRGES